MLKPVSWSVLEGEDSTRALAGLLAQREMMVDILGEVGEKRFRLFRKPNSAFWRDPYDVYLGRTPLALFGLNSA